VNELADTPFTEAVAGDVYDALAEAEDDAIERTADRPPAPDTERKAS
jgi:hypothetical protein